MASLSLGIDSNGRATFLRPVESNKYSAVLATGAEQTFTVPVDTSTTSGKWDVILSYSSGASVWVAINNTAAAPTSTIASTNSELNPVGYTRVKSGDVIHFITSDTITDYVGITLYAIQ